MAAPLARTSFPEGAFGDRQYKEYLEDEARRKRLDAARDSDGGITLAPERGGPGQSGRQVGGSAAAQLERNRVEALNARYGGEDYEDSPTGPPEPGRPRRNPNASILDQIKYKKDKAYWDANPDQHERLNEEALVEKARWLTAKNQQDDQHERLNEEGRLTAKKQQDAMR